MTKEMIKLLQGINDRLSRIDRTALSLQDQSDIVFIQGQLSAACAVLEDLK